MTTFSESALHKETHSWCGRAEETVRAKTADVCHCGGLVREGILLRRRWDLEQPDGPERARLLRLLPAVQDLCHQQLARCVDRDGVAGPDLVESVCRQLAEDDRYLGDLLDNHVLSAPALAFAIECFRDDLHWLGTQVAVLDGQRGVDFLGRILLEEGALHREIDAWEDRASRTGPTRLGLNHGNRSGAVEAGAASLAQGGHLATAEAPQGASQAVNEAVAELQAAARRLRIAAVARQIETLLAQPDPTDWRGWYRAWQTASRLESRLDPESIRPVREPARCNDGNDVPAALRGALSEFRRRAAATWARTVLDAPPAERRPAIEFVNEELIDASSETLTFLEELSLPAAVRNLEILAEDLATSGAVVEQSDEQDAEPPRRMGDRRWAASKRSLRREQATVAGELQERRLAWRMETLFGHRAVAALERLILGLLVVFAVLLIVEAPLLEYESQHWGTGPIHSGGSRIEPLFAWFDLAICLVFLAEFGLKMGLSRRRWLYVRRNWITGLVPAIPVGFMVYAAHQLAHGVPLLLAEEGEWFVLLRALRYLRLPQMARWLRIARPVLRMGRLVAFTLRASDRLVRRLSPLLNRNLVLFERAAISVQEPPHRAALAALRERFHYRAAEVIHGLPRADQCRLIRARIEDMTAMLSAPQVGRITSADRSGEPNSREIPLERIIAWLVTATPAGISDRIGRGLADSVARWCRAFDVFGVRRLPVIRDLVNAARLPSPYDTTAQVANRIGLLLAQMLDRVYWVADLYGTVTAPQLVDSLGDWMIKGTARPARRFLMFGAAFLLVSYLASLLPFPTLSFLSHSLERLVGAPLVILGTLCLIPMLLGTWFRQIANEATDFYSQVADAQFIGAIRNLKQALARRNHAILHQRVLAPELAMCGCPQPVKSNGAAPAAACAEEECAGVLSAAVELLWQDYLDGSPFHRTDIGTTNQLLGNLVLISLRENRLRYSRRDRVRLRQLDLTHARASFRGPYLWFHFISRSLAQHTAKLMVDYNAFALPLSRAGRADDGEILRYVQWLSRRSGVPPDQLELPQPFRERYRAVCLPPGGNKMEDDRRAQSFHTNDFTAVHFLSADLRLEQDIRSRYGDVVADLMRRDRRDNIRRVFRTYPFHRLPKQQRTFNPLAFYQRHFWGGRVLWLPLKVVWWAAVLDALVVRQIGRFVREVLNPSAAGPPAVEEPDPFAVAVRKIHRMRKPLFVECLRMRAQFDPEYLGALLPGSPSQLRGTTAVGVEEDLALIQAEPAMKAELRRLAAERRRQVLEFRAWLSRFGIDEPSSHSLRAMAIAYVVDYAKVRSRLTATRLLERAFEDALARRPRRWSLADLPAWSLHAAWCRMRCRQRLLALFEQPAFAHYTQDQRRRCRRLVYCRRGELLRAVRELTSRDAAADPVDQARQTLLSVGRDPEPWSRQLVTLRAVQTLSVLDLKTYCDLVYELGEYGAVRPERGQQRPE